MDISKINPKEFFSKYVKLKHLSGDEYRALCPLHNDEKTPNLSINIAKGVYYCHACQRSGNIVDFYKEITGKSAREFAEEYGIKQVDIKVAEEFAGKLSKEKELLYYLKYNRGLLEETIKTYKIGYDGYRITIPIADQYGVVVNVRRYKKDAKGGDKMISYSEGKGDKKVTYGKMSLYGERDIFYQSKCIICAGEWDRLLLKQNNFNACCVTGGEGSWNNEWNKYIVDKEIIIIFDCDGAGKKASKRIADILFDHNKVKIIDLALEEKEDITDFFVKYKKTAKDLQELIDRTPYYIKQDKNYDKVQLAEASKSANYNRNIQFKCVVAGKNLSPYQVPYSIELQCDKHGQIKQRCPGCVLKNEGYKKIMIDSRDIVLDLVDITKNQLIGIIRQYVNIPKCSHYYIIKEQKRNIEEIKLIPEVEFLDFELKENEYVVRKAYYLGDEIKTNQVYSLFGTTLPDPKNQMVVHLIEKAVPSTDNIDEFKLTDTIKSKLKKFQLGKDQEISDKMAEITKDLTYNVTKIYHREDLIIAYDLVFHSVLYFKFLNEMSEKGWTELFVLGDSGTGKSKTIQRLIQHYQCGERISAEGSSRAGLIAGLQQTQKSWTLMWGKIPLNDKRLLAIDEAGNLSHEDFANLSDLRSSGIASIIKVQTQKTNARTRLIFIANPHKRRLIEYNYGIMALKEVVGQNEDIRRFDFAISVSDTDVSTKEINKIHAEQIPHKYDSESCHDLIMFIWSRKPEQILFDPDAEQRILEVADEIASTFSKSIPLVQGAEIRIKLARLTVALAGRLYSTDDTGDCIVVKKEHIEYIRIFLLKIYNKSGLDYFAYSQQRQKERSLKNEHYFKSILNGDLELIELLLDNNRFTKSDLESYFNFDGKGEFQDNLNKFLKQRALKKTGTMFVKTPAFITFLKQHKREIEESKLNLEESFI